MGGGGHGAKEAALEISWSNGNIVNNVLPPAFLCLRLFLSVNVYILRKGWKTLTMFFIDAFVLIYVRF